jgi:hypothetical protein
MPSAISHQPSSGLATRRTGAPSGTAVRGPHVIGPALERIGIDEVCVIPKLALHAFEKRSKLKPARSEEPRVATKTRTHETHENKEFILLATDVKLAHEDPHGLAHGGGHEVELTSVSRRKLPVVSCRQIAGFQLSTEEEVRRQPVRRPA